MTRAMNESKVFQTWDNGIQEKDVYTKKDKPAKGVPSLPSNT